MPRYFFNRTDGHVDEDDNGTVLPNFEAARIQAIVYAGETLKDNPDYVWDGQELRVEVTDDKGGLLFTVVTKATEPDRRAISESSQHPA